MRLFTPLLLLLTATVGVMGANSLLLSPIAANVALSFPGASAADVLLASAAYGLAVAFSALTLAPLGDRFGPGRVVFWGVVTLSLALAGAGSAQSVLQLSIAQIIAGLAAGAALPATYALTTEVSLKGRESETLGLVLTGWTLALVAGVSVAAPIADYIHWRAVFFGLSALAFLVTIGLHFVSTPNIQAPLRSRSSPLSALRTPGIGVALLSCAAYMVAFYGSYSYIGTHAQLGLGVSTAMTGLITLSYGMGFGMAVPLDKILDRVGPIRVAPWVFSALAALYFTLALLSSDFAAVVALAFIWGVINHLGLTLIVGRLAALDPRKRGAIMGIYSAITYVSVALGVTVFRPVFEGPGFATAATISGLCILPALLQSLSAKRARPPLPASS